MEAGRVIAVLVVLLGIPFHIQAGIIPEDRIVDWSEAGYPGAVPRPETIVDVTDFGAVGDGLANDQPAIAAALASLGGGPGVVYLPPGDFRITTSVNLPSGVVLRGAGSGATWIRCDPPSSGTTCIGVSGGTAGSWHPVTQGLSKGSKSLTVDDASSFAAGDWIQIREVNGSWDSNPINWADWAVGQIVRIVSVTGDLLEIDRPLRIAYDPALSPEVIRLDPKTDVGIEDLGIQRVSDPTDGASYNVQFYLAVGGWVKGVESNHSIGSHVMIRTSAHVEVTGSYFHHGFVYDGSGTRGYGVTMSNAAGDCLVEGNIFDHLRHAMMVKVGCNGNVWGYNFSRDPYRSETFNDFAGDISLHGHWSFANLWEGNVVANVIIDQYWGPSGPHNTFFRNRAEWYGFIITPDANVTNDQNFVGNEVTKGKSNFLLGLYYTLYWGILGSGHFVHGNNVDGEIEPPGTGTLDDVSYYRDPASDFCELAGDWPSIGVPNALDSGTNRARQRWDSGGPMTVREIRVEAGPPVSINEGESTTLAGEAAGGVDPLVVSWIPVEGLDDPGSLMPTASPGQTTTYTLTATDGFGCKRTDTVIVTVLGVDECADGTHECHADATCTDVPGGYDCECKPGFAGDGFTCEPFCDTVDCDDGDACTVDSCDDLQGCLYSDVDCDDADPCTVDGCDPGTGCYWEVKSCGCCSLCEVEVCDPGTGALSCESVPGVDDGDPCTVDHCDPATGEIHNSPIDCEDLDPCTVRECIDGQCVMTEWVEGCCNAHEDCDVPYQLCDLVNHVCVELPPEPEPDLVEELPEPQPEFVEEIPEPPTEIVEDVPVVPDVPPMPEFVPETLPDESPPDPGQETGTGPFDGFIVSDEGIVTEGKGGDTQEPALDEDPGRPGGGCSSVGGPSAASPLAVLALFFVAAWFRRRS